MEPVIVVHEFDEGLHRRRWVFDWEGHTLLLRRYHFERKEKGVWRLLEFYDREETEGGYGPWRWLEEKEVPWDDELKAEAALALVQKVKVGRLQDFGVRRRRKKVT